MPSFSNTLEQAIHAALALANARRHELATLEHLLLALIDEPDAAKVMQACSVNLEDLRSTLVDYIDDDLSTLVTEIEGSEAVPTAAFQRVIQRAAIHVQSSGRNEVTGANVLVAIFAERESNAAFFLQEQDMTRYDAVNFIAHGVAKNPSFGEARPVTGAAETEEEGTEDTVDGDGKESALGKYCVDLNAKAKKGDVDPLIGRGHEVERCVQVLCRRRKNNPLLVGDPVSARPPSPKVWRARSSKATGSGRSVRRDDLFARHGRAAGRHPLSRRFRGASESRRPGSWKSGPDAVLFIDEIHTVIGAGATSGGAMDASNLLKPALQGGKLRCMGSTTYKEFRQHFEKDRALSRRFQKIDVNEPTVEDAVKILKGVKEYFEKHHEIKYTADAIKTAVELSSRYINDRKLPDKAIDVIDEAGAAQHLLADSKRRKTIGVKEIEAVVAKIARIPPKSVSKDDAEVLKDLEGTLKRVVFGQDEAIEALASAIKLARAGLREPEKPIGNYLFAGPTGVGKTEVAKQLSETLGVEMLRFDMSEYMEKHAVSRLIGAPPGYVGFDQGGLLTDGVDQHPHCVLLLDEIEKAHPDVFNVLLQVMDHGKLTDHNGRQVDFRNVVLIMTSNAGAQEQAKAAIGFGRDRREGEDTAAIERTFTPEFRNRLDAVISFQPLPKEVILQVVEKFVLQLEAQLLDRGVSIELSKPAAEWLAEKGYDDKMGARPLARVIQEHIKKPLAEELLFGKLTKGGVVKVGIKDDKIDLKIEPPETRRLGSKKPPLLTAD